MVQFDSIEYWLANRWDRSVELGRVPQAVKAEFLRQEQLTISAVMQLVTRHSALRVMDLACGPGRIADSVLRATSPSGSLHMTLVDFNAKTLEEAKQNLRMYRNLSFLAADAYDVGNRFNGCFDAVICLELLHHISDLNLLVSQIAKVLKPDALLIGNVFAKENYREWDRLKYGLIKSSRRIALCCLSEWVYRWSPDSARRTIRRLGLARIRPLSREQLVAILNPHFELLEIVETYYYWFTARVAR